MKYPFLEVCEDVTKTATKIPQRLYLVKGYFPIFDQGKYYIGGYIDDANNLANDCPYIVFGDHTRVIKYINTPCYIGADGVKLLRVKNNKFVTKYVYYSMLANPVDSLGYSRHFRLLKESYVKYVEIDEQTKIINELDNINLTIATKEKQLSSLDGMIKSRFIEMFGTIDMSEERDEWEPLENLTKIYTGTTPSTSDETNWDGDILWITPAEMNSDSFYIYDTIRKITEKGRKSKLLNLMPIGTVLLSTRAPIGKVGIVGTPMTCNQGFKNFECGSRLNPVYLYTLLKANTEYLNSLGSGTTFLEVSKSKIAKTKVPVPSIIKQKEFEKFCKLIDKSKFIVQQEIKDLKELLDKKMDEYFGQ